MASASHYFRSILFLSALALLSGCGDKAPVVSEGDKAQARMLASEAEFAVQIREYDRAAGIYAQVVKIRPDVPDYWLSYGITQKRKGDSSGAASAYKSALKLLQKEGDKKPSTDNLLQQAWVLGLLGKKTDAISLLEKSAKQSPDDPKLKAALGDRGIKQMFDTPGFREMAI